MTTSSSRLLHAHLDRTAGPLHRLTSALLVAMSAGIALEEGQVVSAGVDGTVRVWSWRMDDDNRGLQLRPIHALVTESSQVSQPTIDNDPQDMIRRRGCGCKILTTVLWRPSLPPALTPLACAGGVGGAHHQVVALDALSGCTVAGTDKGTVYLWATGSGRLEVGQPHHTDRQTGEAWHGGVVEVHRRRQLAGGKKKGCPATA